MFNKNHIVFTGPESSGKTTLAQTFALKNKATFVAEYAREYLANKTNYTQPDLVEIAKGQQKLIDLAAEKNHLHNPPYLSDRQTQGGNKWVVCDTDLLTIKIWSEFKYGNCDDYITSTLIKNLPNLYVLCKPDFPWQDDPLRENPNDREELYNIYLTEIKKLNIPYIEVGGSVTERLDALMEYYK